MESDDENNLCSGSACMPDIESVSLSNTPKYYGVTHSITTVSPISYTELVSIDITADSCAEYQLSQDGSTYYYWNGSDWSVVSSEINRSSKDDVESKIQSFSTKLGPGNLYLKTVLVTDTDSNCEIQNVQVTKK